MYVVLRIVPVASVWHVVLFSLVTSIIVIGFEFIIEEEEHRGFLIKTHFRLRGCNQFVKNIYVRKRIIVS